MKGDHDIKGTNQASWTSQYSENQPLLLSITTFELEIPHIQVIFPTLTYDVLTNCDRNLTRKPFAAAEGSLKQQGPVK